MSARNLATLIADLAGYNSGILRARAAYRDEVVDGVIRCTSGHLRHTGKKCPVCKSIDDARRYRERKGSA